MLRHCYVDEAVDIRDAAAIVERYMLSDVEGHGG